MRLKSITDLSITFTLTLTIPVGKAEGCLLGKKVVRYGAASEFAASMRIEDQKLDTV